MYKKLAVISKPISKYAEVTFEEIGFGLPDDLGDWFEKRVEHFEDGVFKDPQKISPEKAKSLAKSNPEEFFYRGLHKKYPDYEFEALKELLQTNAKFYFVFNYGTHQNPKYKELEEAAAEFLAIQDPRAFFYYKLNDLYPVFGRGAVIQLIDKDPRSFGQLGLGTSYPEYEQMATDAINIYDPTVIDTRTKDADQ